jgi:hypothetical protein
MTDKEKKEHIKSRLKAHYKYIESLGYEIVGVFLQGSQNYNLDIYESDYMSDVDTKCLVIPKLDNLIKGSAMVSTKYDFEGEQIDVKDVRVMMEMWKKQNQSYIEILFTKYKLINPKYKSYVNEIIAMRDDITQMNTPQLARCISGMSKEKVCALEHEYPATIEKIKKFGYDPKQLASIIRLTHLIENLFEKNKKFEDAIIYHNGELRNYMIDVKKGKIELEEARKLAELYDTKTNAIKDDVVEQYGKDNFNSEICEKLETAIYKLVRFGIISGVIEARQNAFKELCDMMVSSDCDDAADKVIKELSVEHKENFLDYYK